jgi:hypothetical protein
MRASAWAAMFLLAALAVGVSAAHAKDFRPGDVRVCNATRCMPVADREVLPQLSAFYYSSEQPPQASAPRLGAPFFELRYRNGYVTGIVAGARLDRFLSYGVHLGHFERGRWYRVPADAARELRELTAGVTPLRLTRAAAGRSR